MLGSKGILTPMIHGLLRISCSRNPKNIRNSPGSGYFLMFLRVPKSCIGMQACHTWPFDPDIIKSVLSAEKTKKPQKSLLNSERLFLAVLLPVKASFWSGCGSKAQGIDGGNCVSQRNTMHFQNLSQSVFRRWTDRQVGLANYNKTRY